MDRNQFLGLILMLVLLTVYFQFFSPELPPPNEVDNVPAINDNEQNFTDSKINKESTVVESQIQLSDSATNGINELKYGLFSVAATGTEKEVESETEEFKIVFSSKGGIIKSLQLKSYESYDGSELMLIQKGSYSMNILFEHLSRQINLNDFYFNSTTNSYGDSTQVIFSLNINGSSISQIYTLYKKGFQIGYQLVSNGFEKQIDAKNLTFFWAADLPKLEREVKDARIRTTARYYTLSGETDYLSKTATGLEEESIIEPVKWLSFNQKFFTSAIIARNSFSSANISMSVPLTEEIIKTGTIQAEIPYTDIASGNVGFTYFFGPNKYKVLKNVEVGFDENIELGWFFLPAINKYLIIPIFNFLESFISNYGLIIVIMVIIIRILISPLTYKSHISMAKMRVLKPELDDIKERNGGDAQKAQSEQMDLYRKAGINPLSGCIPVVLQFPILVSLFYFIPSAIELSLRPFLWTDDLSSYDNILNLPFTIPFYGDHVSLFTLLMAGSTVLYTVANSQMTTVQGPMKTMQYIMPVMLLFFFNSYPSGLSYYYFISNIVSYGQIALFRKFIDEDKIKVVMEENKKRNANKKKSKFQMKLEDAMKASQEAQKKSKKK